MTYEGTSVRPPAAAADAEQAGRRSGLKHTAASSTSGGL